jgi:hypothetical protein
MRSGVVVSVYGLGLTSHSLFGPTLVERQRGLAVEQGGRAATEPIRAPTSDCRTRIAVGDRALAVFEEGLLARVWPSNPFPRVK